MDPKLAKDLEKAGSQVRFALTHRDALIAKASADGASLREIAEIVGLSHVGVKKVVDRLRIPAP